MKLAEEWAGRCLVTGNPWGTDTWHVDHPCHCPSCQAWLKARERCAKVAEQYDYGKNAAAAIRAGEE